LGWPETTDRVNRGVRGAFGEEVVYQPLGLDAVTIRAPHFEEWEEVQPDTGAPIVSQRPNVQVRLADLPAPPVEGDRWTCRGVTFAVEETRIDGTGAARLVGRRLE
jgi:hypothetical protein